MMTRRLSVPLLAAGLLLASVGLAQPYRYVDENGETVYSQTPPPGGDAVRVPVLPGPPEAEIEAARTRLQQQLEAEVDAEAAAAKAAEEAGKASAEADLRRKNCAAARQNLETVRNLGTRRLPGADGTLAPVSDEERARLTQQAEQQISEFCK